jgi:FtsP/CotA-like multicopper oxidase with cupredoxin domain
VVTVNVTETPRQDATEQWSCDKDTVIAYPGEGTTDKARFDIAGLYVWHCHILEHEDNEMMRP